MDTVAAKEQLEKPVDLSSLDPADARREIARDVIAQLTLKKFELKSTYFQLKGVPPVVPRVRGLKELLHESGDCQACALGACLIAVVTRENKFDVFQNFMGEVSAGRPMIAARLTPFFSREQMRFIEDAFEDIGQTRKCLDFAKLFPDRRSRLFGIMENIVEHGEFCPERDPRVIEKHSLSSHPHPL